jgi:DNA-binding response OmpR family regulator
MRILIVEDKVRMASLLQRAMQREGYLTLVANNGEAALGIMQRHRLAAVVMDVMMPKLDGFEVLAQMRSLYIKVPTILLTARDTSHDIVHGLDLGADDYLTKPFELAVLMARLRALTRRPAELVQGPLRVGDLVLRTDTHEVECAERRISLTPMEFTLLEALMQRVGQVVRKETLAEIGWGDDEDFNESTLYVFMRSLRNKLHTAERPELLHTVRGVGYMLKPVLSR